MRRRLYCGGLFVSALPFLAASARHALAKRGRTTRRKEHQYE